MDADDSRLVARALVERDTDAFGALVQRHQSRVRGWLRHLAHGDTTLADDLAQETFMRAWRNLGAYRASGSFEAWLLGIARNEFLQHLRKHGRDMAKTDAARIESRNTASAVAHDTTAADRHDVAHYLAVLAPNERNALILVHGFGLSHGEASAISDMPLGTVKSHLKRGIAKIRRQFGLGSDDDDS